MSCNPAIGGLGKGHLVREIDALDGLMGRAADAAGIQYRLLNRRKGPAVQGPRTQADRKLYKRAIQGLLGAQEGLTTIAGEVTELLRDGTGAISGVMLADATEISCKSVVLTSGTFLNGVIHIGDKRQTGGRMGDKSSTKLADWLLQLDLQRGRLKTGTPPRLDGRTIDWSKLDHQLSDEQPVMMSFMNHAPLVRQISCRITNTNQRTHEIVRENLSQSAMYGGHIEGIGPRYCPSIEDKVVRFADKESHQIFLEPEGLDDHTIYPNGISTSLPAEIQQRYVRSILGLEQVVILQPGYAIEYDFFDPSDLAHTLETRVAGLFFAGQINGTTGYEEAAAQGLLAGSNAALMALGRDPFRLGRSESYMGVMVDDLVSRGVTEPYRMFTSRAEFRLSLRADNADQRLTAKGAELGLVSQARQEVFARKVEVLESANALLENRLVTPHELLSAGAVVREDGQRRTLLQSLTIPGVAEVVEVLEPKFARYPEEIRKQVATDALYAQFLGRQLADIEAVRRDESFEIPAALDYSLLSGLSAEQRMKLVRKRPVNLAEAGKIEGMTPAAISLILAHCKRSNRAFAAGAR
jgi:tRNA uridine 5-carboxymethylaminomethyl modification enzyme